jgi:hypothetical protein
MVRKASETGDFVSCALAAADRRTMQPKRKRFMNPPFFTMKDKLAFGTSPSVAGAINIRVRSGGKFENSLRGA